MTEFVLMPVVATEEMVVAGRFHKYDTGMAARETWQIMVAARPEVSEAAVERAGEIIKELLGCFEAPDCRSCEYTGGCECK